MSDSRADAEGVTGLGSTRQCCCLLYWVLCTIICWMPVWWGKKFWMSWILIFPQLCWVSILCPYVMSFDAIYMYITFTGKIIFVQVGTTHGLRENFWKMKTTHYIAVYPIERRNVCFFPSWSLGWPSKGTQLTSLFAKRGRFITGYNWTGN